MTENQICIDFISTLRFYEQINKTKGLFLHIPNEISGNKNPIFGSILKRMGKVNGAPDYIFMWENDCGCLEFKTEKGKLTQSQKDFQKECEKFKIKYEIARSTQEGIDILKKWGFIK